MPEQQAWSTVSVCSPPSLSLSPASLLDLLHFPQCLPFFSHSLLSSLSLLLISHIRSQRYVHIPLLSDKFILFSHSLTWSSFPHPATVFVHFVPCSSPAVLCSLVLSFLFSAFLLLRFFPRALPNTLSSRCF